MINGVISNWRALARWQRITVYGVLAVCTYFLMMWQLVPRVLQWQLTAQLTERLGRQVELTSVALDPFELSLTLTEFHIKGANPEQDFMGFKRFYLDFEFWALVKGEIRLEMVDLETPYLLLGKDAKGELSVTDILARLAEQTASQPEAEPLASSDDKSEPFNMALTIGSLTIDDGRFGFTDESLQISGEVELTPIRFSVTDFDTRSSGAGSNTYQLGLGVASGGTLNWTGTIDLITQQFGGEFGLSALELSHFEPFLQPYVAFRLKQAVLDLNSQFLVRAQAENWWVSTSDGALALKHLKIARRNSGDLPIDLGELAIDGVSLDTQRQAVQVNRVRLSDLAITSHQTAKTPIKLGELVIDNVSINTQRQDVQVDSVRLSDSLIQVGLDEQGQPDLLALLMAIAGDGSPAVDKTVSGRQTDRAGALISPASPKSLASATEQAATVQASGATDEPNATPWYWKLGLGELKSVAINLTESSSGQDLTHPIAIDALTLGPVDAKFEAPIAVDLRGHLYKNSEFTVTGPIKVTQTPETSTIETTLALSVQGLALPFYQPFFDRYLNLKLNEGSLSLQGDIHLSTANPVQVETNLALDVTKLRTQAGGQDFMRWDSLHVAPVRFDLLGNRLSLGQIRLTKPYARVEIAADRTTNIGDLVKTPEKAVAPETVASGAKQGAEASISEGDRVNAEPTAAMALNFDGFVIEQGEAFFADRSLTPDFASALYSLEGEVGGFSTASSAPAKVNIKGLVDKYAPVSVTGTIQPLLADPFLDLALVFKHIELTTLNPYSQTYAGYVIDKGQLSVDLNYQLEQRKLKGRNKLVVDQLQLGKKTTSKNATSLPLKLAVALLKDRNGVIDLGLDVSGSLDDPEFELGALVGKAFGKVIRSIVSSPFTLLGKLVGEGDKLNEVAFDAGQFELNAASAERLAKLAQALNRRPVLKLEVLGSVKPVQDESALKVSGLLDQANRVGATSTNLDSAPYTEFTLKSISRSDAQQRTLSTLAQKLPDDWRELQRQTLTEQLNAEQGFSEEKLAEQLRELYYQALLEQVVVSMSDLSNLAQSRAKAVKAFLVEQGQVKASRVFVLQSHIERQSASLNTLLTVTVD
jgi:outer membrane protein OmpA-like peptidoglycan-associated protein